MAANPLFDMVNRDRQQSALPPVTNQNSGGRNPLFDMVNSSSASPRTTTAETPGLGTNILRAGQRGWHQLLTGVNVAALETGLGDEEDVADIARHQAAMQAPDIKPSAAYENFMRAEGFWNSLNELRKAPVDILSQLVTESFIASAPSFAAAAGLGAVGAGAGFLAGGPAGAAAGGLAGSRVGMGIGSASVEATAKLVEAIGDEGVDVTDPNELSAAMANDALMSKVRQKAIAKGVPIGVMDAVTFSLAGKFGGRIATRIGERAAASATGTALTDAAIAGGTSAARKQIASAATRAATAAAGLGAEQAAVREVARAAALAARPMRSKVGSYAAELGAQAAGGAIGEAISQPMAGEATNWPAIISEAAAEFGQTPVELAMSERGRLTNLARRALAGQPVTRQEVAQAVREQSQQPTTQAPPVTQTSAEQQVTEAASQGRWTRGGRQFESEPPDIPLSKPAKEMTFDEFLQNIKVRIGDERDANSVWVLLNDHSDGFHMGGNQAQVRDPLKDAYESIVGKPAVDKTSTTAVTTETPAIDEQEVARRRREALGDISIPGESVPLSGLRPDISPITPAESATGLRRALDPIEVARYGSSEEARDVYQKYGRVGKKGPKNKRPMNWELLSALTLNGNTPDNILALIAERAQPEHAEVLENIANHPRAPRASVIASQRLQEFGLVAPEVEAPEQVFESENPVVQQVRDTINIKRLKTIARENSGELRDSAVDLALASKPNADDILLSFLVNRAEPSDTPVLDAIIGHQRASEETVATAVAKKNQRLGRGVVRPKGVAQRPLRRSTPLTTLPAHNETLPENNATLPTASQVELGAEIPAPVVEPSEQGEAAGNVSAAEAPVNPIPPTPEAANAPKEKGRVQVTPPAETPVPKSQAEGPVVPKRKISQSDFANTARRLVENGGKRIGELEWNVRGDRIEVNHYVTGRDYGYIDLKTGEMFPVRQQDKSKLQEVVNNINEEARQSLIRQELESARNYPFKNAKRIQALEQELTTPPPKSEVATAPTREAPAEEPVVPAEKRPRGVTKLAWDNEQARARAEATTKQPWEMTKEEWESARRDAATAEKNSFKGLSGSKFKEQFMWGTKARIRLEYGASPEPIRKGGVPVVTHRAVVQKALSEGKPIPPEVQAEYPDLFPKGASNAEAVRSNAGQISPRGAEREGSQEEGRTNLQRQPSEQTGNQQAQGEVAQVTAKPAPAPAAEGPQPTWTLAQWNAYRDANKPLAKSLSDHLKEWVAAKLPIRRELFDSDTTTERIAGTAQRENGYRVNTETGMFEPQAKEQGAVATTTPVVEEEEGDAEILAEEQEPEEVRKALAEEEAGAEEEPTTLPSARYVLAQNNLSVTQETAKSGRTYWRVTGEGTKEHSDLLTKLGAAKPMKVRGVWSRSFFDEDPTEKIAKEIGSVQVGGGVQSVPSSRQSNDEYRARDLVTRQSRRALDESTAERQRVNQNRPPTPVLKSTADLIRRGIKHFIPEKVINGQLEDISRGLRAYQDGKRLFLLANPAGSGKTFILGGLIRELRNAGVKKFLYVTNSQDLIAQVKYDLADYGLEGVTFASYAKLGEASIDNQTVVLFDESHAAKNIDARRSTHAANLMRTARMTILSSATPFDNPAEAKYLEPTGVFDEVGGFNAWAMAYGATPVEYTTKDGQKVTIMRWDTGSTPESRESAKKDILAARAWMKEQGIFVNRQRIAQKGMVASSLRKGIAPQELVKLYDAVEKAYGEAGASLGIADSYGEGGTETDVDAEDFDDGGEGAAKERLARTITMMLQNVRKRILEGAKVQFAIERAKEHLAQGKQVAIFTETKAERNIGKFRKRNAKQGDRLYSYPEIAEIMSEWEAKVAIRKDEALIRNHPDPGPPPFGRAVVAVAEKMYYAGLTDATVPSVPDELMAAFPDALVYNGSVSGAKASQNLKAWKDGKAKVLILTMAKGGTGLSLHDTSGKHPQRVQIMLNVPWKASQVDQVSGRLDRYGVKKPVEIEWLFAKNIPFEVALAEKVGSRMVDLAATVHGKESSAGALLSNIADIKDIQDFDDATYDLDAEPWVETVEDVTEQPEARPQEQPAPTPRRVTKAVSGKASRESVGTEEALEQSDVVAESPRGSEGTVFTSDNEKVEFVYRLVPISGIITSHDMHGNLNPDYPQDMQPRSKDEAPDAYITRVQGFINNKINPELLGESKLGSDGAPIITPSGHVLSGNTRVNALELANASYKEQSAAYRKWLADNAERFGFTEEQVKDIPNAILVRELIGDLSTERLEALGDKFNVSNVATKDAADVAKSDAKNLTNDMLEMLSIEELGDINNPVNAPFVSKFLGIIPESERGQVFQNGKVTQDGIARIRNAILQKAYGRDMVVRVGVSTDDNVRNVSSALVRIAPQAARVKALIDSGKIDQIDPMPQIAAAADVLSGLRAAGLANQIQAIAQNATLLTGDNESVSSLTDLGRMLLSMYDTNKNSAKAIGDILSRFFTLIENSPRVGEESLVFLEPIPIEQHFSQAKKDVKAAGQKSLVGNKIDGLNERQKKLEEDIRDYWVNPRDTNTLGMGRILTKDDLKFIADVGEWIFIEMQKAWYKGYQAGKGFFLTQKEVLDHYRQQINGRPKKKEIEVVKQQYEAFVADKRKQLMAKEAAEAATEEPKSVAPPRVPPKQGTQTELGVDDESLGVDFVPLEDTLGQRVDRMLENFEFEMVSKGQPFSMFDKVFAAIQNVAQYGDANTEEAEAAKKRLQEGQFPLADNPENPVSGAAVGTRGAYDRNVAMTQFYYDTFRAMFKDVFVRFAGEWKPEGGFNVADMRRFLRYVYAVSQLARYEAAEVPLGENALATARRAVKDASSSLSPERKAIYDKYAQEYFNTWNNMLKQLASLFPSMEPFLRRISNDFDTPYIPNIYQTENDIVLEEVGRMRGGKRLVEELKGGGDFTQVRDPLAQAMLTMRALITASMKNQIKANMVTMQRFGNALSRKAAETLGLTIESKGRQLDEMVTRVREWIGPDAKFVSDETLRNLIKYFQEPTEIGGRVMVNYYAEDGSTTQIAVPVKTALAFDAFTSPALPLWFNLLYRLPVQVFKIMTTGASLAFGARNLVKDVGTGAVQRYSKTKGWEAFAIWLNTLTTLAKNNDAKQIAKELGIAYGSWINVGNDRATADLAEMFGIETVGSKTRSIVERFEMFLSATEVVTRAAEGANVIVTNIRNGSYKVGNFKDPSKVSLRGNQLTDGTTTMRLIDAWHQLSREQMDEIFVAEQRVSTDFRDMGRTSQWVNQMVPYFGAAVGGMRQMVRAYRGDKNAFVMRAGMYILIPTLVSWWLNKDEDWYKDQDAVGKYMNWQFKMGDTIVRVPKPQDVGHLFGTIPEAILNSLYQQDKDEVVRMMKPVMEQLMPFSVTPIGMLSDALGPIGKTIVEQYANKNVFTGREIVPKSELGFLPIEQVGPWTSQFATMIASAMNTTPGAPDYLKSPRRVDHIVRGIFGRVPYEWGDAFVFLGNPTKWGEKANIPAVGAFFQRGGTGGVTSLAQNQVYDDAITLQSYQQSRRFKLTPAQERYLERLNSTKSALGIMRIEMRNANTPRLRRDIGDEMRRIAQETIATRPENMEPEPFSAEELRIRTAKRIIEGAADLVRQKVKDELRARRPNLPDDKLDAYVQRMLGRDHRMRKLSQLRRFVKIASERPSERAMINLDIAEQQAKFIIGEFTGVQPQ